MKKVIRRLKLRNHQFKQHPITRDNRVKALFRYISFNILNRIQSDVKYKWIHNLMFFASRGDAGIVGNIYYGLYEFNESMFLLHLLRDKDTFVDVGANVGHYSLLASGIRKCLSIAIEPVPTTYSKLKKQVELNNLSDKIKTLNIGVGSHSSNLYFSTDKNTMNCIVDRNYKAAVEIEVRNLDHICSGQNVNLLKIDVEGYEKFVLQGCAETLKNPALKVVIIEVNNSGKFYGAKDEDICKILDENNFKPYKYNPLSRELTALNSHNTEQFNTIFIRDLEFVEHRIMESSGIKVWNKFI